MTKFRSDAICPTCGLTAPKPCSTCAHYRPETTIRDGDQDFHFEARCHRENTRVTIARSLDGDCRPEGHRWKAKA